MRAIILPAALLAGLTAAHAQTAHPLAEGGRYQLMDVNEKIVRLDTETGAFDLCDLQQGGWNCRIAEEERVDMKREIDFLKDRVERLEAELADRRAAEAAAATEDRRGFAQRIYDYVPGMNR
ncbi:hypothetical protein [Lutibaculum baratangense]|nr:hypothetical protein [Lutibaculum baratangense]